MRTTLDIEEDVLKAARALARRQGVTAGRIISTLARRGLARLPARGNLPRSRNGVPVLPSRGEVITLEHIQNLIDQDAG